MAHRVLICRSNPIAPDPRVEKIARTLSGAGYRVTMLGWDRTGELPEAENMPENRGTIFRMPIQAQYGHGLANLPALLRWQVRLLLWLIQQRSEYDIIHACDFDTILPALFSKWVFGKKVVYDIFDFYADHLRATPGFLKRLIRWLDLKAIGWADALILVDESRKGQIQGSRPKRCAVIYNSPEDGYLPQDSLLSQRSKLHLAYVGLLQVERGLFEMLDVLRTHPEWSLEIAGFGGDEEQIRQAAQDLPNVTWRGRVPYDEALRISQAADVLFATYDPAIPNHRYSSPNKVFEAMMLGKPIIVARGTNMDDIIQQENCGVVVEYGEKSDLETALVLLEKDLDLRQELGRNSRCAYEQRYGWNRMQQHLLNVYQGLLER